MDILYLKDLDFSALNNKFYQTLEHLSQGNFTATDVKKIPGAGLYRARLDDKSRLLFKLAKLDGKTYLLLLEFILNHDYGKSKFLRGIPINEDKLIPFTHSDNGSNEVATLSYINPNKQHFHLLDKILSFDDEQEQVLHLSPPLIIIGSAGSGKTAIALERLKNLKGKILYVTLSPFLAEHAAHLYYSYNYENEEQEADFLSFREFVETLRIPEGKKLEFKTFEQWFLPHRYYSKIKNAHQLFEEFKGVITGGTIEKEFLTKEEYLQLGVRQSIFLAEERLRVYDLFEKYLLFLKENNYYDINMVSFRWLSLSKPHYDFVLVDEVQDITNIQLYLILKSLKNLYQFILCGDSNQIVHPNFFSWSKIKTMFYLTDLPANLTRILTANYRNSPQVVDISNRLLKIKNLRFGSIDKESTYLIQSISDKKGQVMLLEDNAQIKNEWNNKTKQSTHFAVLVMRNEDKAEARKYFSTPLIFSIQEAKGLEYDNVLLLNFISDNEQEFHEICGEISFSDFRDNTIAYGRAREKSDKSLEAYKFYINSLYVAFTRAIQNLYIIEKNTKSELLSLLGLVSSGQMNLAQQTSSLDEWKQEARQLEKQGRDEQAELIRKTILGTATPPWKVITTEEIEHLKKDAFNPDAYNKKAKDKLFDYAIIYNDIVIMKELVKFNYNRAEHYETERGSIFRRVYVDYANDDVKRIFNTISKYGVDYRDEFNLTPLLAATRAGAIRTIKYLIDAGADTFACDNYGKNALQTALFQAFFSTEYLKNKLPVTYPFVLSDNIKVKIENRLVKINSHQAEYFLLNFMISVQSEIIKTKRVLEPLAMNMTDFEEYLRNFPDNVLQPYRRKRQYINSILAKNEIDSENIYNKKLFVRIWRGNYIINANLEILIKENWINVYKLIKYDEKLFQRSIFARHKLHG